MELPKVDERLINELRDSIIRCPNLSSCNQCFVLVTNNESNIIFANGNFFKTFDYTEDELYTKKIFEIIAREDIEPLKESFYRKVENFYCRHIAKDGSQIWVRASAFKVSEETGNTYGKSCPVCVHDPIGVN